MNNYAIEILENEIRLLEKCLSEWDINRYPESRRIRDKRLKDLQNALDKIKE